MRSTVLRTLLSSALLLAGCAVAPKPAEPQTAEPGAIVYETAPCYGLCPVYRVTIASDGTGTFTGMQHTVITGDRKFAASPDQFAAFAKVLAPYRPKGTRDITPGQPDCVDAATDMPSVDVQWKSGTATDKLTLYYGCNLQTGQAMAEALRTAPEMLPIADFIGKR
ncbi:DUF6438 domain-containing protein [Sphingomonas alpina]|uniref:DUF6438 domain-containing protein n=1 Tax=Sphingomonas alpina TaxID=653931 RepID=A0A7H0LEH9_9SPHN|nr:DUF6438 domain-containing protein [Sphingomonas alpina]QNQ08082.1 hypothetical protein H3Z74_15025 [Sphingomonas alpina]